MSGLRQFLATESPLQMMINAFYFTLKAPFILEIFKFGHVGKQLDEKAKLNSKIHDVPNWEITIQILPDISRNKDNQTMKFGQSIELKHQPFFSTTMHKMWWRK